MNMIVVSGNTVAKPMLKQGSSKSYTRFRIAVKRRFSQDLTDFFDVICYGKVAETVCERTDKGSKLIVTGMMTTSDYETTNGERRTGYTIQADNVEFLSRPTAANGLEPVDEDCGDDEGMPF